MTIHPDDLRYDLAPEAVLARELRRSEVNIKSATSVIECAEADIAEALASIRAERLRVTSYREALTKLGALTTGDGEIITNDAGVPILAA